MDPSSIQIILQKALQHHQAGRVQQAQDLYGQVLSHDPQNPEALHLLGLIAIQIGNYDLGIDLIRRAISAQPNRPDAHANLGVALEKAGRLDEAIAAYRQAVNLDPKYANGYFNIGNALMARRRIDEAIPAYQQAIASNPNFPQAMNNLGVALRDNHRLQEALAAFQQAIALKPDYAEAFTNLGNLFKDIDRLDDSLAAHRSAIAFKPDYADAHYHLGNILADKNDLEQAIASYRRAIALNPNHSRAHNNLGIVLRDTGQADEAIAAYRLAIQTDPGNSEAHSNLILMMNYHPATDSIALRDELRRWNDLHALPLGKFIRPHSNDPNPDSRLRFGYVSSDFREHVVGRNVLPLLENHDHSHFEIFCYAQVFQPDALTARFQKSADQWRDIVNIPDDRVADQIREDRIDILVDLGLHTTRNRLLVFARKPAPVQVTFAGYPGSTGLTTMDYRLTDPYLDPPTVSPSPCTQGEGWSAVSSVEPGGGSFACVEKTITLPDTFWCYDPLDCHDLSITPLPAEKSGIITFGCLNNFAKINDKIVRIWGKVLERVKNSRLLLLAPPPLQRQRILDRLRSSGVDPARIEFAPLQPRRQYLQLYNRIDIGLDSFPYNGHTTSLDSFWMGVPVITLVGPRAVSRAGFSQLSNLGLQTLAATSEDAFNKIAVDLAQRIPTLAALRVTLRGTMQQSPLMNAPKFARDIEAAYRQMWRTWCQSAHPNLEFA